jgi:membrane peptidoglycan carboxypeptidase
VPPPADPNAPQLMVGVWMGNSDHSPPDSSDQPAFALSGPGRIWNAFLRDYTTGQPLADFTPPANGLVQADIDAWSGGTPGPWTTALRREWFIAGTEPGSPEQLDQPGLLYRQQCGGWYVDIMQVEPTAPSTWLTADAGWMARARQGVGVRSQWDTTTAYQIGQTSWGGPIAPVACTAPPTPGPTPAPGPTGTPGPPGPKPTPPPPGPTPPPGPQPTKTPHPHPHP